MPYHDSATAVEHHTDSATAVQHHTDSATAVEHHHKRACRVIGRDGTDIWQRWQFFMKFGGNEAADSQMYQRAGGAVIDDQTVAAVTPDWCAARGEHHHDTS